MTARRIAHAEDDAATLRAALLLPAEDVERILPAVEALLRDAYAAEDPSDAGRLYRAAFDVVEQAGHRAEVWEWPLP